MLCASCVPDIEKRLWWTSRPTVDAVKRTLLQARKIFRFLALSFQMLKSFNEKPACTGGGIKYVLAKLRIRHSNNKLHDRSGTVKLARISRGISHLPQHSFRRGA